MRKVNVGCGPYKMAGAINIDMNDVNSPEIVRDVRKGLPFDNDSVDEMYASHFLEHLNHIEMLDFLEESYRVLKAGACLNVVVPLLEPYTIDHVQVFAEWTFDPLEYPETPAHYGRVFKWTIESKRVKPPRPGNVSPFDELHFALRAVK